MDVDYFIYEVPGKCGNNTYSGKLVESTVVTGFASGDTLLGYDFIVEPEGWLTLAAGREVTLGPEVTISQGAEAKIEVAPWIINSCSQLLPAPPASPPAAESPSQSDPLSSQQSLRTSTEAPLPADTQPPARLTHMIQIHRLEVFDLSGKSLLSLPVSSPQTLQTYLRHTLPPGTYLLKITYTNNSVSWKKLTVP